MIIHLEEIISEKIHIIQEVTLIIWEVILMIVKIIILIIVKWEKVEHLKVI